MEDSPLGALLLLERHRKNAGHFGRSHPSGGAVFRLGFGETNIVTVYILGVLLTATWTEGRLYGILSSLLSVLTFNFFFIGALFQLGCSSQLCDHLFYQFLSSFLTSSLTIRIKTQARMAVQKNYSTEVLLEATQLLQQASGEHEVLAIAVSQLGKLLDRPILYYPMDRTAS